MSEVKHTPGPWHTVFNAPAQDRSEVCSIYDASGEPTSGYVADVYRNYVGAFIGEEEYRANARLIASAPDLLEALYEAEEYLDNRADADHDETGFVPNKEMTLLVSIRAAIAKATGAAK